MGYISSADQNSMGQRFRRTAIAVAGFGISALVLIFLPMILHVEAPVENTLNWPKILATAALLLGLASILLRRVLLSRRVLNSAARQGRESMLSRLSMTSIIGAALAEAVGIVGFLGFLMTGVSFAWPVGAVSLILVVYSFPRRSEWVRALEIVSEAVEQTSTPVGGRILE